jgi:uncharacterized protein YkwD
MVAQPHSTWVWAATLALTGWLQGCAATSVPHPAPVSLAEMELATRQQINQIRQQNGLPALQRNSALAQVARNYSDRMARESFFDHRDPNGNEAVQRLQAAGLSFQVVGENLYRSVDEPDPVKDAVEGWMASPGHRENILRPIFTETGIGIRQVGNTYYFTQLFLQP